MKNKKTYKLAVLLFFVIYLVVGLSIFKDYGISWDEQLQRKIGAWSLRYILLGDTDLFLFPDRHYGPFFEMVLIVIEMAFNLTNNLRALFLMRHFVTFLLFFTSTIFFYLLCKDKFSSWKLGLLGTLFLILNPRIFAHSFYNSKDIAFLAMFIISVYTLFAYLKSKKIYMAVFHGLASAILIDIRIVGLLVPLFTCMFTVGDIVLLKMNKRGRTHAILNFIVYFGVFLPFMVLFRPLLWSDTLGNLTRIFLEMKSYPISYPMLYMGKSIVSKDLPWHYIPVWIAISTPLIYLAGFIVGVFFIVKYFFKAPTMFYSESKLDLISLLWFFLPLISVIGLRSAMYDAWRHMFFIYPALTMISLSGLVYLFRYLKSKSVVRNRILKFTFISIISAGLSTTTYFMIRYHPFQNVYFNTLAGRDMSRVGERFELDYWGLSYKQALEYILKNDKDENIKVCAHTPPGLSNVLILPTDKSKRLSFVFDENDAKYLLTNYRFNKGDYPYEEYYSIKVKRARILGVYKIGDKRA
ncbi:hypothetical protein ACFL0T_00210 [Candidatus Omnitrophota bacterium]